MSAERKRKLVRADFKISCATKSAKTDMVPPGHTYLSFRLLVGERQRIGQRTDGRHVVVTDANQVNFHAGFEMRSSHVAVEDHAAVAVGIFLDQVGIRHVLVSIHQNVRVRVAPDQGSVLRKQNDGGRARRTI